jgi:hypothetical protein
MADHAWCRDPSRDERVRAAEDGRAEPLPTLEEAIADMIPKSVSASSPVDQENKGDGMRTERVTLEVTHDDNDGHIQFRNWDQMLFGEQNGVRFPGESVRVVEEAHFDDLAQVAMERDAAIRERESWKLLADRTNERLSAAEARVAELERQVDQADAEDADTGYALRLFVDGRRVLSHELGPTQAGAFLIAADHLAKYLREEYKPITDAAKARVSKLEAASGGGEVEMSRAGQIESADGTNTPKCTERDNLAASGGGEGEPDAFGVVRNGNVDAVTHRLFRKDAERSAEQWGGTVVPLYRQRPQPRGWLTGEEREALEWWGGKDCPVSHGQVNAWRGAIRNLLARSSPPEVVLEENLNLFDAHGDRVAAFDAHRVRKALAAAGVPVKESP